jgi:AraC-like DNA-binding protein
VLQSVYTEARRTRGGTSLHVAHAHREIEFNLVIGGNGTYFLEDGRFDLIPGTLVWLLPGQFHRLIRSPDLDMWVVICAPDSFDEAFLADVAAQPCRQLSTIDALALCGLLTHVSQDTDETELYRVGLEYAVRSARHLSASTAGPARKALHPAVVRALSIMRTSSQVPALGASAKACGVSAAYLGQLFTAETGRGFVEWRNRAKLERFHVLYPQSGDLLTAAFAAGFGSYTQFHRVFASLIGVTPGEWARQGAPAKPMELPSGADAVGAAPAGSTRMAWYSLSARNMPLIADALTPDFAEAFRTANPDESDEAPIGTGISDANELRIHEPALVEDLRRSDPRSADMLRKVFARNNLFDMFVRQLSGDYQIPYGDLVYPLTICLYACHYGVTLAPPPTTDQILRTSRQVRRALHETGNLIRSSIEERQQFEAAVIVKAIIASNAITGAHCSGDQSLVTKVSDGIQFSAKTSFGLDLRSFSQ